MNTTTTVILTTKPKGKKPVSYAAILKAIRTVNARFANLNPQEAAATVANLPNVLAPKLTNKLK